ncbi:hypothetical protein V9T40_003945 [Parthenolecanium corni]|uniref:RanBP-type and C3HC4-type zinc finger-containing protein 1 n=1 Tax=Parthenolecanium corni TaxID=536013 RepID=A0AAN9Y376_9HEMI
MASAVLSSEPSTSTASTSTSSDADALDLLQRLQQAIFSGQPQMAANVASELAKMRANCSMSMRRSEIQLVDVKVAEEPIRVPVEATTTISDLEMQIYQKHKVPIRGRCVVLLETTLPSQENLDSTNIACEASTSAGLGYSTNTKETMNGTAMDHEIADIEWACSACTYLNEPADIACAMCETNRVPSSNTAANSAQPEVISLPSSSSDEELPTEDAFANYQELLSMEQTDLITNLEAFECPICEDVYYPGDGVILKTCLHHFCRDCLTKVIESCSEAEIKCPYTVDYLCDQFLQDREIRALLSEESYAHYLQICMKQAESKIANAFHCKTPDCSGWCEFDNDADIFACPVCQRNNCLACQAIHDGLNCAQYQKKILIESANNMPVLNAPTNSVEQFYLQKMKAMQYDTYDMIAEDDVLGVKFNVSYHFERNLKEDVGKNRPCLMKRLGQEAVALSTSLPLSYKSSVFVRCDTDRLVVMKALITGPADTPYANGCFEFDIYFPPNYPNQPMLVNFETTGRQSVRFNPNLYNDGKVCLSLLNTWHGRPEERWNPKVSTSLQALVSIQSLILVPEPYFNEPGFEKSRKTEYGKKHSSKYNINIMEATVKWAMLEQLRNPTPCFKDIIRSHFWLKRNEITNQIINWINLVEMNKKRRQQSHSASSIRHNFKLLCDEFAKLTPPPGFEDLSSLPQFKYKAPYFTSSFPLAPAASTSTASGASTSTASTSEPSTSSFYS